MKYKFKIVFSALVFLLGISLFIVERSVVYAQNDDTQNVQSVAPANPKEITKPVSSVKKIPSLFFTYWQHKAIWEAKNSKGIVRTPTQVELDALDGGGDPEAEKEPGIREITLGGIVYTHKDEWVIWINGQRVTPDAVPKEVLDLRVFNDYIEIKWLDEYTEQIFPLRLRAHQRFNLDARMFLPG